MNSSLSTTALWQAIRPDGMTIVVGIIAMLIALRFLWKQADARRRQKARLEMVHELSAWMAYEDERQRRGSGVLPWFLIAAVIAGEALTRLPEDSPDLSVPSREPLAAVAARGGVPAPARAPVQDRRADAAVSPAAVSPGSVPDASATTLSVSNTDPADRGPAEWPGLCASTDHMVREGDTLSSLARRWNTSIAAIRDANGMRPNDDRIYAYTCLLRP